MSEPICPICKVNMCEYDSEPPGPGSYSSTCFRCFSLSGYRDHSHTYYGSPAQVAAGTIAAGHSWRTAVTVRPIIEDNRHVGYRCSQFRDCGWEHRFTPEELELCPEHSEPPRHGPTPKAVCANRREHRRKRGEVDERGYITDHGRVEERRREDAANWDPGQYFERTN